MYFQVDGIEFEIITFFCSSPCWIKMPRTNILWAFHTTKGLFTEGTFIWKVSCSLFFIIFKLVDLAKYWHCNARWRQERRHPFYLSLWIWQHGRTMWFNDFLRLTLVETICPWQWGLYTNCFDVWQRSTYSFSLMHAGISRYHRLLPSVTGYVEKRCDPRQGMWCQCVGPPSG